MKREVKLMTVKVTYKKVFCQKNSCETSLRKVS